MAKASKNSILAYNVSLGDMNTVKRLLIEGADINFQSGLYNESLLMIASRQGNIDIIKLLINKGINLNLLDISGNSVLIQASAYNRVEIVKLLIKHCADMTIKNIFNCNFILAAGEKDILKYSTAYVSYDTTCNWLRKTSAQRIILNKEPSLYKSFIERDIKITSKIKQELPEIISANELNLL